MTSRVEIYDDPTYVEVLEHMTVVEVSNSMGPQGLQGIQGTQGIMPKVAYVHNQSSANSTWNIVHSLGFHPNITVVDSAGTNVEGDVEYVSTNELTVRFTQGFSGKAYLS